MDTNDLYHVAVRMHGWEFMSEASHINAQKAVRGLASDLQEFHAQAQTSSAAQLMQQGEAAGAAALQSADAEDAHVVQQVTAGVVRVLLELRREEREERRKEAEHKERLRREEREEQERHRHREREEQERLRQEEREERRKEAERKERLWREEREEQERLRREEREEQERLRREEREERRREREEQERLRREERKETREEAERKEKLWREEAERKEKLWREEAERKEKLWREEAERKEKRCQQENTAGQAKKRVKKTATFRNVEGALAAVKDVFDAGNNYLDVAEARSDQRLADIIREVGNQTYAKYKRSTEPGTVLYRFDYTFFHIEISLVSKEDPISFLVHATFNHDAFPPMADLWEATAFVAAFRYDALVYSSPASPAWVQFKHKAMAAQQAYQQYWIDEAVSETEACEDQLEEARVLAMAAASDWH